MSTSVWSLDATSGELLIRTGVAGPAAKMGHRLTIAMRSWQATVQWRGQQPASAELVVDVDSLEVVSGEGGVTPLTGPERAVARSNALKSLDAKKYPQIRFTAEEITATDGGYRLAGTLEIHGKTRPLEVDLAVADRGGQWEMSLSTPVMQSDYGIKPYSLMLGSLKVADEVTVQFNGRYAP